MFGSDPYFHSTNVTLQTGRLTVYFVVRSCIELTRVTVYVASVMSLKEKLGFSGGLFLRLVSQ